MKKLLISFLLVLVSTFCFAEMQNAKNGWKYDSFWLSRSAKLYFIEIDDSTEVSLYFDITLLGDTLCEFSLSQYDQNGEDKIFYFFDEKATFYYDVFLLNAQERFAAISFSYNEKNKFSTGFHSDGLGQNKLVCSILNALLNGKDVKFVSVPALAEYQEIKEFILPSVR